MLVIGMFDKEITMAHSKIGLKIKALRKNKGLTQEQLGVILGVSMQAVSKWECGGVPDLEMLIKLAKCFDITTDALLGLQSANEKDMEEILFNDISMTHKNYQMEKVCRYSWAMLKGMSTMPAIKDDDYCHVEADEMVCSQARVTLENGLATMSAIEDFHYFMVMPEPENGYKIALSNIDDYTTFFERLSNKDTLKMLFYLYSLNAMLFSAEKAASDLNMSQDTVNKILDDFITVEWVFKESASLSEYDVNLYRPNITSSFVPLLRFATEMIEMPKLWYISYFDRNKPLLKNILKSKES